MYKKVYQTFECLIQITSVMLLISLAAVVVIAVTCRFFGSSLIWYDEVASVLLAWLTYYGAALAALNRRHMGFSGLFLKSPRSLRRLLFFIAEVSVVSFFLVVAWAGWHVLGVFGEEALISLPFIPLKVTQSVIPIGGILFIVAELLSAPHAFREAMVPAAFQKTLDETVSIQIDTIEPQNKAFR